MGEVAPELYTQDGTVDIKGNPALKQNTGNWRACPYILGTHHCSALLYSVMLHCSNALFLSALLCFSIAV
jgi:hypothetical protein